MSSSTNDEVYNKLQKHLDSQVIPFPKTKSGVEIKLLKNLFTPEEAKFALKLGLFPAPAKTIARDFKKEGYTVEQVTNILDNMVKRGLINGGKGKDGNENYYAIAFLVIGLFEYRVNTITKEQAELFQQYVDEAFKDVMIGDKIKPQLRTIPNKESLKTITIDESLDGDKMVMPFDDVEKLLEGSSDFISVANCVCRQEKDVMGHGCDHPKEVCFQFGGAAHFYVDNGWGRQISREECLKILKKAPELGLVIQPTNSIKPTAICCCCGCSCGILSNARKMDKPAQYFATNYYSKVDPELCASCETCIELCPMIAITMNDNNIAEINLDRCIGCGVCIPSCPQEAIHLVKKNNLVPPENMLKLYQEIGAAKAKSK
jgi:electron transport complex protein RnfB